MELILFDLVIQLLQFSCLCLKIIVMLSCTRLMKRCDVSHWEVFITLRKTNT